jgi:hypothetical protein
MNISKGILTARVEARTFQEAPTGCLGLSDREKRSSLSRGSGFCWKSFSTDHNFRIARLVQNKTNYNTHIVGTTPVLSIPPLVDPIYSYG